MVNCADCKDFDRVAGVCDKLPSELNDQICLLRHICYSINSLWQAISEEHDDDDFWKK
jgi:hypothetical protein